MDVARHSLRSISGLTAVLGASFGVFGCADDSQSLATGGSTSDADENTTGMSTGEVELDCEVVGEDEVVVQEGVRLIEHPDELLAFCGVKRIDGSLFIAFDAPPTGWDGLGVLGALEVIGGLTLNGIEEPVVLPNLHTVSDLTVRQDDTIQPPSFPSLRTAGLVSIQGPYASPVDLSGLEAARELSINTAITLDALVELESFSVGRTVVSLPEAPRLERISGAVQLEAASALTDLALLRNVHTIEGGFTLSDLRGLSSLADLSSLQQVGKPAADGTDTFPSGGFSLTNMVNLGSVAGLEQLSVIHGDITIVENPALTSLEGFDGVTAWRADGRVNVVTAMSIQGGVSLDPLSWLASAELPSPCEINFEDDMPSPPQADEFAALCSN